MSIVTSLILLLLGQVFQYQYLKGSLFHSPFFVGGSLALKWNKVTLDLYKEEFFSGILTLLSWSGP